MSYFFKKSGAFGERYAADYLRKQGYILVGVNYKCRFGEIDLIAENKGFLVFVEVKTRDEMSKTEPRESVTWKKQQCIIRTALQYVSANETELQMRFDVIEVTTSNGCPTHLNHIVDAFDASNVFY